MAGTPYDKLLSSVRLKPSKYTRSPAAESLSDKMRIVNCSAFRRLQSKAQVFSLARAGDVRTRLTHSIEVSNYGELIADGVVDVLLTKGSLSPHQRLPFEHTVENACLLHDIGNPPFGHMGEYAIRQWFKRLRHNEILDAWVANKKLSEGDAESQLAAFEQFDGNPQGLRVMTRLQWFNNERGLNLTTALIGAYCKYIGPEEGTPPFHKKLGFFPSERETIRAAWKELGLKVEHDGLPAQRHPLAFIMEAADDIAYCLSDIEDALEKRVVTEAEFLAEAAIRLPAMIKEARKLAAADGKSLRANGTYHHFRVLLSRKLVSAAIDAYTGNEKEILVGKFTIGLLDSGFPEDASNMVRDFARAHIYTSRDAVEAVVGGLAAMNGILDAYLPMLVMTTKDFQSLESGGGTTMLKTRPTESQLYSLLPRRHKLAYQWQVNNEPNLEPVHRAQLVIDYLSGMTDTHALKIHNMIGGTQTLAIE